MNPWFAIGCFAVSVAFVAVGVKAYLSLPVDIDW
jgi:hypothetical protein